MSEEDDVRLLNEGSCRINEMREEIDSTVRILGGLIRGRKSRHGVPRKQQFAGHDTLQWQLECPRGELVVNVYYPETTDPIYFMTASRAYGLGPAMRFVASAHADLPQLLRTIRDWYDIEQPLELLFAAAHAARKRQFAIGQER